MSLKGKKKIYFCQAFQSIFPSPDMVIHKTQMFIPLVTSKLFLFLTKPRFIKNPSL